MANDNLKDFTLQWIVTGFLLFCLLGFAFTFLSNNGNVGLDSNLNQSFYNIQNGTQSKLLEVQSSSDEILNITANTNPEASDLGSRDSVAVGFKGREQNVSFWNQFRQLISLVFSGDIGKMLISVIGGMLTFLGGYYIYKYIRQGN